MSRREVCQKRRNRAIPPFVGLVLTQEGDPCRSIYEAMFDAWLHERQEPHEHEARVPGLRFIADFKLAAEYVEIVGMAAFRRYGAKHAAKRRAYEEASVPVRWIYPAEVERLYAGCALPLRFRSERRCEDCGRATHDLVKGACRLCYMRRWRAEGTYNRTCAECGRSFESRRRDQRYCCRACYWRSLELEWPDWDELDRRLSEKPASQVAIDIGVKPTALYMRLRRRQRM